MLPHKLQPKSVQTVLSIAGSDPSGGAGIQADLKTFAVIGVYGGAVITSLTVQNTLGVKKISTLGPELVKDQITAVLADLDVSHIKIGMVGSTPIARAISDALRDFKGEVIYDPVMRSTSGLSLVEENTGATMTDSVLDCATVITPNIPELSLLVHAKCAGISGPEAAANLFDRFPRLRAIVLTGGHGQERSDTVTDYLFLRPGNNDIPHSISNTHPKIKTGNCHGTGCTFAAAFAAFHQQTCDYPAAFERSVNFMGKIIERSANYLIGKGNGPLLHHLALD